MRPIQRTFDSSKARAIPIRLCQPPADDAAPAQMAVIEPADCVVLELEGEAASTAWTDSVFVSDFIGAFEDSIPAF